MSINHWPELERPREKLLAQGAKILSDAELIAIFLRTGVKGKTALDLSRQLLQEFGGLRQVVEAQPEEFCRHHGLGLAKYVQLQATLEIGRRYLQTSLQRTSPLKNPTATYEYLTACLRGYQHEVFACLFLDNALRVIQFEELFHGSISHAAIHPREVIKRVLSHNAAAVIFAHNHPSGIAEPSEADKHITQQLKRTLNTIEVRVLDHIIIGDGQVTSFAERGLL